MTGGILAFLTALLVALPAVLNLVAKHRTREQERQKGLANAESEETDASLDRVDAEYQRMQQPRQ